MSRGFDAVVIGAGPAGLSAARMIAAAGLRALCIERLAPGGEINNLGELHEYPVQAIGPMVATGLLEGATDAGVELAFGEVTELREGPPWTIATEAESYEAPVLVLAMGLAPGRLGVAEEARFDGRGISHCASCDGPIYAGQRVAAVGEDKWAVQEALDLASVASHVTLVSGSQDARLRATRNIELVPGRVVALLGDDGLERIAIEHAGARREIAVRAAFVYLDRRPQLGPAEGLFACDGQGRIMVDSGLQAGRPGAYAAGDIRAGAPELASAAIADGERAGQAAVRRLRAERM